MKGELCARLRTAGHTVDDVGPHTLDPHDDYPLYARMLAERVAAQAGSYGIVLGGSGQGEAMVANRIPGIRAVVYYGPAGEQVDAAGAALDIIASTRFHNDANVLSLGARFLTNDEAWDAVSRWLATPFSGDERHRRRLSAIDHG